MQQPPAVEAVGVQKAFGHFTALRGIDLRIDRGERVALFGANGAGKTTFLKIAATLVRPTGGVLRVHGHDVREEPEPARQRIGFLSHQTYLYRDLSPWENLTFFARCYGQGDEAARIEELLRQVGLWRRRNDPVRTFSRGLQQRAGIARVMLHSPDVLLLDEPFTGLDANAEETLNTLVSQYTGDGKTVILTTHSLEQGLRLSSRTVILHRGRVVFDGASTDQGVTGAFAEFVRARAAE